MADLENIGQRARAAARVLATAPRRQKDAALLAIAESLNRQADRILQANQQDVSLARAEGLSDALVDRLTLTPARLEGITADIRRVAALPDPVGVEFDTRTLENGLRVRRRRTPIGVLGVIYESRPNVTVEVAALSLKSGNAAILRGGRETIHTNVALSAGIREGVAEAELPPDSIQAITDPDRDLVLGLLRLNRYLDMIIPRGGASLHQFCRDNATVPVITGGIGICHLFVDESADLDQAVKIIHNAKTQRPSVCNALDTVLIHRGIAPRVLPRLARLLTAAGVRLKADPESLAILSDLPEIEAAAPGDWDTEWLSLVLGVRVVDGLDEAMEHIHLHSTGHSDGILTRSQANADRFVDAVDSAVVYVNASTRFTDGGQLGIGAEVAVSTQKLHARGPMALEELTTYKWIVIGDGHIRP